MRKITLFLFTFLICCQPNQINFDQAKWENGCVDGFCNDREPMVADLMKNHLKVGMAKSKVISLLGNPNFVENDGSLIGYDIFVAYSGIDPSETKNLQITFKDSVITNFRLNHWEAN